MNALHNQKSSTAITRLIQFAFALMLVFISVAASGCGVVDSNGGEDIEAVTASEATPEAANLQDIEDSTDSATSVDDEEGYPEGLPAPPVNEEVCTVINGREFCS